MVETIDSELHKSRNLSMPLPTAAADWVRKTQFNLTNNDRVERLHLKILNDPKRFERYRDSLNAVTDAEAIEGSLAIDQADAARMIREEAAASGDHVIARLRLKAICIHLNVVLERYGQSRKSRRQMVNGQHVATASENGE
jgi:hypothetical protein